MPRKELFRDWKWWLDGAVRWQFGTVGFVEGSGKKGKVEWKNFNEGEWTSKWLK